MSWLRLIRWSNLLIIFLTQAVAWWCVIMPLQKEFGHQILLTPANFLLLTVSTVLIAAGGYIINDYFDIRIDAINKPDAVILEKTIPRRLAIIVHSALNALGLLCAASVAWQAGHPEWLLLQLACIAMLWRYSTTWKRRFVTGNIVVAIMTALTIIALIVYEPVVQHMLPCHGRNGKIVPLQILLVFAVFAFLLTWMREVIKDMEDYKGDAAEGCETMPIRWGLLRASRFVQCLGAITIGLLAYACWRLLITPRFFALLPVAIVFIITLLFFWTFHLPRKATTQHYAAMSRSLKIIMVIGISSLILYRIKYV